MAIYVAMIASAVACPVYGAVVGQLRYLALCFGKGFLRYGIVIYGAGAGNEQGDRCYNGNYDLGLFVQLILVLKQQYDKGTEGYDGHYEPHLAAKEEPYLILLGRRIYMVRLLPELRTDYHEDKIQSYGDDEQSFEVVGYVQIAVEQHYGRDLSRYGQEPEHYGEYPFEHCVAGGLGLYDFLFAGLGIYLLFLSS